MSIAAWFTIAVVVALTVALIRGWGSTDLLFVGATTLLALAGIITPEESFAGFANPGVLTVAALFVVAAGMRETGVLEFLGRYLLGMVNTQREVLWRLSVVVLPMSAFLNNTPIVAMFVPILVTWCRRNRISPSAVLIPLSFLAILGGTCTLIGTSTNLVVHGLMLASDVDAIRDGIGMFEISAIGIPYALIGVAYLIFCAPRLLPERKELLEQLSESRREYLIEVTVAPECRMIEKSIEAAGLRNFPGLFLIEIRREEEDRIIGPVRPTDVIKSGDKLVFAGVVASIVELEQIPGLIPSVDPAYEVNPKEQRRRRFCEAVISSTSPLIGQTVRETDFRAHYGAAIVAVHRGGSRMRQKIGDIQLRAGDTLLMQTPPHFWRAHHNDPEFFLISDVPQWRPLRRDRTWLALTLFVLLLIAMSTELVSPLLASMSVAMMMIVCGCISSSDARQSVEWQVLVTIAAAFGLGTALQNSGAVTHITTAVMSFAGVWGPLATLAAVYLLVSLVTAVVTNNAAAILMFPFCLELAAQLEVSPRPFIMALVLAASASFATPIGYQTNLMVYGPGGYRFMDFVRVGLPLNLVLWLAAILLIPWIWPFQL